MKSVVAIRVFQNKKILQNPGDLLENFIKYIAEGRLEPVKILHNRINIKLKSQSRFLVFQLFSNQVLNLVANQSSVNPSAELLQMEQRLIIELKKLLNDPSSIEKSVVDDSKDEIRDVMTIFKEVQKLKKDGDEEESQKVFQKFFAKIDSA